VTGVPQGAPKSINKRVLFLGIILVQLTSRDNAVIDGNSWPLPPSTKYYFIKFIVLSKLIFTRWRLGTENLPNIIK